MQATRHLAPSRRFPAAIAARPDHDRSGVAEQAKKEYAAGLPRRRGGRCERCGGITRDSECGRTGLLCVCLVSGGLRKQRAVPRPGPAAVLPPPIENAPNMRRMLGGNAAVAALHPEPGDIWAGIVPTQPPEALTPFPATRPRPHPDMPAHAAPVPPVVARRAPPPVAPPPVLARHAAPVAAPARPAPHATSVQLTAAGSAQRAVAAWKRLQQRLPRLVRAHQPAVSSAYVHGKMIWRLRAGGFATVAEADAFCAQVRAAKSDCWVVGAAEDP